VLRRDPSDKLPGAAGVGPKRAAQLVRRYGTLDGGLDAGLFQIQAKMLRFDRLIATMDSSAPLVLARRPEAHIGLSLELLLGVETTGRPGMA
jgi:DNA polymerase-1